MAIYPNTVLEPKTGLEERTVYRKENGNDLRDGDSYATAVQDPDLALSIAASKTPPPSVDAAVSVLSDSADSIDGSITLSEFIVVDYSKMRFSVTSNDNIVNMASFADLEVRQLAYGGANANAACVVFDEIIEGRFNCSTLANQIGIGIKLESSSGGNNTAIDSLLANVGIESNTSIFSVNQHTINEFSVAGAGVGVINTGQAAEQLNSPFIQALNPSAVLFRNDSIGAITVNGDIINSAGKITDSSSGITSINATLGFGEIDISGSAQLNLNLQSLQGDITIGSGCEAYVIIPQFDYGTYTVTNNGTLNGIIGGVKYGTFASGGDVVISNWNEAKAELAPADPSKSYKVVGKINATDNTSLDFNGATVMGNTGRSFDGFVSSEANHILIDTSKGAVVTGLDFDISGTGSKVFQINDPSGSEYWNLSVCSFQNNTNLGDVEGLYAWYENYISYNTNADGLTITDVNFVVRDGAAFQQTNTANTQLELIGDFDLLKFTNCGFGVPLGNTGLSVSGITSITRNAIIDTATIFNGDGTYVDDLTVFNGEAWDVEATGIAQIYKDSAAEGNISKDAPSTTVIAASNTPTKITGASTTNNLFRVDDGGVDNRLRYLGQHSKRAKVSGGLSIDNAFGLNQVSVYLAVNGVVDVSTRMRFDLSFFTGVVPVPISGSVDLNQNDYVELWVERNTGAGDFEIFSYNWNIF